MKKIIKIDDKDLTFECSARTMRLYREKFKRDLMIDMSALLNGFKEKNKTGIEFTPELLNIFEDVAYIMNKQGDDSQPDDIYDWLDQFEMFSIYTVLPEIIELWKDCNQTLSTVEKKQSKNRTGI